MDIEILLLEMFGRKRDKGERMVTCAKEERNGISFLRGGRFVQSGSDIEDLHLATQRCGA
jgi:hypothetical protein